MNTEVIVAIVSLGIAIIADIIATIKNTGSIKDRINDTKESVKTESTTIQKNDELLHTKTVANSDKNKTALSQEHGNIISSIEKEHNKLDGISRIIAEEAQARRDSERKQELRLAGMNTSQKNVLEAVQKVPDLIKLYEHEIDRNIDLTNNIENLQNECSEMQKEYEELESKYANLMHICSKLQQENKRLSQEISNMKQQMNRKPSRDIEPLEL